MGFFNTYFLERLLYLFSSLIPLIVLGVLLGNVADEIGALDKLAFLTKPIVGKSNLPIEAGATMTTLLASGTASNSMLANFFEQGTLSEKETIVTSVINTIFGYLNHLPTYYIPIVLPLLGLEAGFTYISIQLFIGLIISLIGVIFGSIFLEPSSRSIGGKSRELGSGKIELKKENVVNGFYRSIPVFKKILPRIIIIYIAVNFAFSTGWLQPVTDISKPLTSILGLPGEASTIIAVRIADVTSSLTIAGELIVKGSISPVQGVGALLIGSLLSSVTMFFRYTLPNYVSYFGAELGSKVAVYNLVLNLAITSIVTFIYLNIF